LHVSAIISFEGFLANTFRSQAGTERRIKRANQNNCSSPTRSRMNQSIYCWHHCSPDVMVINVQIGDQSRTGIFSVLPLIAQDLIIATETERSVKKHFSVRD